MRYLLMACLTLGLVLAAAPAATANTASTFDRVIADADNVRREARDVKQMLRDRNTSLTVVSERLRVLDTHAQALKAALAEVDAAGLNATQVASLDRARNAVDSLLVLLNNKSTLLADATQANRQRGLLRAKAEGIARRAEIVEQQMVRLRG